MNYLQRVWRSVDLYRLGAHNLKKHYKKEIDKGSTVTEITKRKRYNRISKVLRTDQDIAHWKEYIDLAKSAPYYNRYYIYQIYEKALYNGHLDSQIDTRKTGTLSEEYILVDKNGNINKEKTKLIQKVWFQEIIDAIIDSVFHGFTAIDIDPVLIDGEIQKVTRIPSEHFSPERNLLLPVPENASIGIRLEEPITDWLLCFGKLKNLGKLAKASKYALYSDFSLQDWSRHSERFGTPFLTMKTPVTEDAEVQERAEMLGSFGNNGYALLDEDEVIEPIIDTRTNPHLMYRDLITYCESVISKIISGQTGTSDEKAFVGSAEVHERILNKYVQSDMMLVTFVINFIVIPKLIKIGYPLNDFDFEYKYFYNKRNPPKPKPKAREEDQGVEAPQQLSYTAYLDELKKKS